YCDAQLDRWIVIATSVSPGLALAAARVRQAKEVAQVAESSEAVQVQSDTSLTRLAWPNDQFYGPGALADTRTWVNNA
ncbi:RND transporter, partial [Pseudomonas syringae pv. tagetis]